jgi:hypothetical protein
MLPPAASLAQEPLLEVMELMGHTDVLLGMHGAAWTNALFLKRVRPGFLRPHDIARAWRWSGDGGLLQSAGNDIPGSK